MIRALVRTMRPHQWVKNLFVLAPLVFAKELLHQDHALRSVVAFGLFCLASSTVYILNDLADVDADRAHPVKRHRPIASGQLPETIARTVGLMMGGAVVLVGSALDLMFAVTVLAYLLLNLAYTFRLKRIAYVDVMCITTGFELRVLGGGLAAEVELSTYLLGVTFLLASFLGFGKRLHELQQGEQSIKQRSVLQNYDHGTLLLLLRSTGIATLLVYAIYTVDPQTRAAFGTDYLIVTALMPAFGILRFIKLVNGEAGEDSPTEAMLKDRPFLVNLVAWAALVMLIIYLG